MDKDNNCLVIFTRAPYHIYDLNEILLNLPLDLKGVCHLEGGPEATLYVNHKKLDTIFIGSYEDDFVENDDNYELYELPNVIGISKK